MLSRRVVTPGSRQSAASGASEGLPKKRMPPPNRGICRRGHDGLGGGGASRSEQAMSTAGHTEPMYGWKDLPWKRFERQVFKLQKRIYRASLRGDVRAVHELQRLLVGSWSAKCLAVRKVTQDNRGKRTAGVDGVKSLTPTRRLALAAHLPIRPTGRAVRRVWIPKPGKPERRPLGIPTVRDRAAQTLVRLALEPEWEARFEPNSFGFRPGRSTHDALEMLF